MEISFFLAIPKTNWRKSGSKREDLVKNEVFFKRSNTWQSLIQTRQLILRIWDERFLDKNGDFALVGEGTLNNFLLLYVSFLLILVTNNGLFRGSLRYSCPHLREPFLQRHLKGLCQTHPPTPPPNQNTGNSA